MAYNNKNILLKMVEIQNLVLEKKRNQAAARSIYMKLKSISIITFPIPP